MLGNDLSLMIQKIQKIVMIMVILPSPCMNDHHKNIVLRVIKILLQAKRSKVCQVKPTSISKSATYVVDVRNLRNQDDVKKDEFGIWNYSGSHPQPFKIYYEEDNEITVEKCNPGVTGTNIVYL